MRRLAALFLFLLSAPHIAGAQHPATPQLVPKFPLMKSGLELERRTHPGAFLDVLGRKSAVLGYEHRQLEAWVYPLQVLDQSEEHTSELQSQSNLVCRLLLEKKKII